MKTSLLVLYALNKKGYVLNPDIVIELTINMNNMKTPKYSVGDVFRGGPTILYVHTDSETDDIHYCLTSYYKGRPPVHCSEKELDEYFLLLPRIEYAR